VAYQELLTNWKGDLGYVEGDSNWGGTSGKKRGDSSKDKTTTTAKPGKNTLFGSFNTRQDCVEYRKWDFYITGVRIQGNTSKKEKKSLTKGKEQREVENIFRCKKFTCGGRKN